jgi:hypothetical protein
VDPNTFDADTAHVLQLLPLLTWQSTADTGLLCVIRTRRRFRRPPRAWSARTAAAPTVAAASRGWVSKPSRNRVGRMCADGALEIAQTPSARDLEPRALPVSVERFRGVLNAETRFAAEGRHGPVHCLL